MLAELLEENRAELAQEVIFAALLDDDGETGVQIGGLLTNFRAFTVETLRVSF